MHLGNGAVTPACAMYALGLAGIGIGIGAILARRTGVPEPKKFALATSLVFAAQTFNVPIISAASGHVLGGFLLASLFGGGWGAVGMTLILTLQSLVFGDGGLMTLGCNVLNMAVLPCLVVYPLWSRWTRNRNGITIGTGAMISALLAAMACSLEVLTQPAARGSALRIIGMMTAVHAIVGGIEAVFTVLALRCLSRSTPIFAGTMAVASIILAASFGASPWPDGLEFTLARFSLNEGHATGLLADYTLISTLLAAAFLAMLSLALTSVSRKRVLHA
jgi:cobalt/nickel transport system permease protein